MLQILRSQTVRFSTIALSLGLLQWGALSPAAQEAAQTGPQEVAADKKEPLVIGTRHVPPFMIKGDDDDWSGLAFELLEHIAAEIGFDYKLRESDLEGLITGVENGGLDASIAALTITAEREERGDFTHPFYSTGLGIAVQPGSNAVLTTLKNFFSIGFLKVALALAGVLFIAGILLYIFERKANAEQFGGKNGRGLGAAFWWSAVTMTTVGYGDKAPVTLGGRLVALVWMFASIIIISGFTASIASSLTVNSIQGGISGPDDLPDAPGFVATVSDSTGEAYLKRRGIRYRTYPTPREAMLAVEIDRASAAVYDAPVLRYLAKSEFSGELTVLAGTFERQDYGIFLPVGSEMREPMNHALLEFVRSADWEQLQEQYLGSN